MNELFSEKVVTSRRTYYFDVKETKEEARYLIIGELTQVGSELERHRVMVFEESLDFFLDGLNKAADFILSGYADDGGKERQRQDEWEEGEAAHKSELIEVLKRLEKKVDEMRAHFK